MDAKNLDLKPYEVVAIKESLGKIIEDAGLRELATKMCDLYYKSIMERVVLCDALSETYSNYDFYQDMKQSGNNVGDPTFWGFKARLFIDKAFEEIQLEEIQLKGVNYCDGNKKILN